MLKSQFATEEKNHNKIKIHKPSFIKPPTTRIQRRQLFQIKPLPFPKGWLRLSDVSVCLL